LNTTYKIECWGASGGNSYYDGYSGHTNTVYGAKGGYCSGTITISSNLNIYIYVGQSGEGTKEQTFNGGGTGGVIHNAGSGGGATDVRLIGGIWSNFNSLKSRIIVAAGGGGADHHFDGCSGGYAGGLSGQDGFYAINTTIEHLPYSIATGATQISGGKGGISGRNYPKAYDGTFGIGGNNAGGNSANSYGSGGGGGYYGGGGGGVNTGIIGSGAGGSSFISGYTGCDAIKESSTEENIEHTGQPNHYSGYVFTNPVMIDGGSTMPSPSGGTETGHSGNGYCIITWQQLPQ